MSAVSTKGRPSSLPFVLTAFFSGAGPDIFDYEKAGTRPALFQFFFRFTAGMIMLG